MAESTQAKWTAELVQSAIDEMKNRGLLDPEEGSVVDLLKASADFKGFVLAQTLVGYFLSKEGFSIMAIAAGVMLGIKLERARQQSETLEKMLNV